nr:F-box only protein 42-like [Cherax quadricarinatus]
MAGVNDLPEEILEYILCLISPYNDLRSCRQVCHRWYTCCQGVVEKRKSHFFTALKVGCVKWFSPTYPSHIIPISRRYSHSACVFDSSMYVFGGCTSTNTTFNDLWRFDLGLHEWTRLLTTGTYPSPKAYASMVTWNNCLVLFGGWTHPSLYPLHQQWVLFSELHVFDILGNRGDSTVLSWITPTQQLVIQFPGSVRKTANNVWVPPVQQPEIRPHEHHHPERHQLEPNVNGQRGVFLRPGIHPADQAESSSDCKVMM